MFSHTLLLFLIINSGFFSECGAFLRGNDSKLSSSTDRQIISHIFRESIPQISSRNDIFSRVRANSANVHEVVFVIVPRNMDQLTSILYDLSDPLSSNYGRHWTRDRIVELTSNPESHHAVISYLQRNGIAFISETAGGEYVTASASVAVWERIFNTEFFIFHQLHSDGQVEKLIRAERYWIPIELDSHVESVFKTIQMPVISSGSLSILSPQLSPYSAASLSTSTLPLDSLSVLKSESEGSGLHLLMEVESLRSNKSSKLTLDRMKSITILDAVITPAKIKSYYNMSASVAGSSKSTQAVFAAIKQYMSPADLQFFQKDQGLPAQAISSSIGDFVSNAACLSDPTNCAEGNLDTQYIMGISGRSPTTYWYTDLSFSDWLVTVADTVNPPLVFSISYGQEESYTSASELNAFSTQAIKLGAMGVTILVASGDDGANSRSVRTSGVLACGYTPEYPASSPYVTAVGATSVSCRNF